MVDISGTAVVGTVVAKGEQAAGSAAGTNRPVLVGGDDGTNVQTFLLHTDGKQRIKDIEDAVVLGAGSAMIGEVEVEELPHDGHSATVAVGDVVNGGTYHTAYTAPADTIGEVSSITANENSRASTQSLGVTSAGDALLWEGFATGSIAQFLKATMVDYGIVNPIIVGPGEKLKVLFPQGQSGDTAVITVNVKETAI
jgi:hypothetical protein|tara:strand:- start:419 stop:1009 length:591 start_codon:yes stop_codon:yes gene_type:complete